MEEFIEKKTHYEREMSVEKFAIGKITREKSYKSPAICLNLLFLTTDEEQIAARNPKSSAHLHKEIKMQ
jgi:hypothetical protein